MKILLMVHDMVVPNRGGGAPRTEAVAKALRRASHDVFVMAPFGVGKDEAERKLGGCTVIPTRNVDRNDRRKQLKHALYIPFLAARTVISARRHKVDMIFVHDSIYGAAALFASMILRIPLVLDATDLISEYVSRGKQRGLLYRTLSAGERMVLRGASKVITVSEKMKDVLVCMGARDVDVVYDGVDFESFHSCPPKYRKRGKFVYIYQGGMDYQDGLQILIPAAEIVIKEVPNAEFWLVGSGAVVPQFKKSAAERGLDDHFLFTGWVKFSDVTRYISDADAGLVILPDTLSARIRVTLKTFEYWACGKPIIAARLPALEEVIKGGSGLFYRPDDARDLAEKMIMIAKDAKLRDRLSQRGRASVKRFEWRVLGDEIVSKCEDIVSVR